MLKTATCVLIGSVTAVSLAGTASAEIVLNGGFESGTGAAPALWTVKADPNAAAAGAINGRVASPVNSGSYSEELQAINSSTAGSPSGEDSNILQNTAESGGDPLSVAGGPYTLNYFLEGSLGVSGVIFVQAQYVNAAGAAVGGGGSTLFNNPAAIPGTFTAESINLGTPPAAAAGVQVEFSAETGAVSGGTATAFLDDISVNGVAVPEPTAFSVLGLATLGLLRRRRS